MYRRFLLSFSILIGLLTVIETKANDSIITRRQVFNFEVGDSFSYSYYDRYAGSHKYGDDLQIILDKYYSPDSSTVNYMIETYYYGVRVYYGTWYSHDTVTISYGDLDSTYIRTFFYRSDTTLGFSDSMWYDPNHKNWSTDSILDLKRYKFYTCDWDCYGLSYAPRIGRTSVGDAFEYDNNTRWENLKGFVLADGRKWGTLFTAFPVGISETPTSTLSVYPNPFTDKLHIDFDEGTTKGSDTIIVRDIYGKVIKELKDIHQQNEISMADESSGLYFLTLQSENHSQTWKVIKE